jgi:hypothetical protein
MRQKQSAGQVAPDRRRCDHGTLVVPAGDAMRPHRNLLPWIMVIVTVRVKVIVRLR